MTGRLTRLLLLLGVIVAATLLAARHARPPSLAGVWRDQSPAALLYEFRDDRSVWLVRSAEILPVFRYTIESDGQMTLYDGLGRRRELLFTLTGDRLILRDRGDPTVIFLDLRREG